MIFDVYQLYIFRCECATGWYGLHCKKKSSVCNTQNSNELCGHGVCVSKLGTPLGYTCICDQVRNNESIARHQRSRFPSTTDYFPRVGSQKVLIQLASRTWTNALEIIDRAP